jgi:hypothetical protein
MEKHLCVGMYSDLAKNLVLTLLDLAGTILAGLFPSQQQASARRKHIYHEYVVEHMFPSIARL